MIGFFAGFAVGIVTAIAVLFVLRRELELYRRSRGVTLDFTHRSRM